MQEITFPHRFIAIEGNIGAGKTTLCKRIAEDFGTRLILEQFTDNPFLPKFYEHPERYAFPVELFFMTERHKQLQEELTQPQLFGQSTVFADYSFVKTLLFARNNLVEDEFRLFQQLFDTLNHNTPSPDLLVYLHRPVEQLLQNIRKRGRSIEQDIDPQYLIQLQDSYFEYFRNNRTHPILIIDVENADLETKANHYQIVIDCLKTKYTDGLHQIRIIN